MRLTRNKVKQQTKDNRLKTMDKENSPHFRLPSTYAYLIILTYTIINYILVFYIVCPTIIIPRISQV